MRLWILSDLHVEFGRYELPDPLPDADVAVVAGDLGIGGIASALKWLDRHVGPKMEVVFVAGNHDFYDTFHTAALVEGRELSKTLGRVHFLENEQHLLGGIRFLGCTLWTDFLLTGNRQLSMLEASNAMSDYRRIEHSTKPFQRLTPLRTLRAHQASRRYLDAALGASQLPTVVVSHHAPSGRSVPSQHQGHRLSPVYASDLDDLILRHRPTLWVHGHIHDGVDYMLGATRVVSDPGGYPGERTERRTPLVIEI